MKIPTKKIISIALATLASLNFSSPLIASYNNRELEEIKSKRVNKRGNLVIRFCNRLKDYEGFVEVNDKKFQIVDADIKNSKKIVWKDVNLPVQRGKKIITDNLLARYLDDKDNSEPLTALDRRNCGIGILPLILIGAGIAAGSSGGGSGSSSSN
tara:strand:+ start:12 stop:476 length:465 start_codon:yes stop_codon:yes gene_type:complete